MLRIKELREEKHLTQQQLAEAISTTNHCVSKWEKNAAEPNIETICQLADFFQVTTDYLLGRENESGLVVSNGIVLSRPENELLTLYRRLSPMEQGQVVGFAKSFVM